MSCLWRWDCVLRALWVCRGDKREHIHQKYGRNGRCAVLIDPTLRASAADIGHFHLLARGGEVAAFGVVVLAGLPVLGDEVLQLGVAGSLA